jgi:hypothetical protein
MALNELTPAKWWYVMRREVMSGLVLGGILGSIAFIRISIWQQLHWANYGMKGTGNYWYLTGLTVSFSLVGIVLWGTLSGSMIPMVLKKLNLDPATSSAPFVATLVDVTGLIIYFSFAAMILNGTLLNNADKMPLIATHIDKEVVINLVLPKGGAPEGRQPFYVNDTTLRVPITGKSSDIWEFPKKTGYYLAEEFTVRANPDSAFYDVVFSKAAKYLFLYPDGANMRALNFR